MIQSTIPGAANVGLPGYYYTEPKIFTQELKTIWRSTWQFVGRESDLPNPGDYLTCMIGLEPIFVIRTPSGSLQSMYNVCPHRGARLLNGQGNCSLIRCPYHAWIYDLEGKLRLVSEPKYFPDLDKSLIQLHKAQVDTWGGFIFVNPDPEGESLRAYLADIPDFLKDYKQPWEELREIDRWSYEQPINWKLFVEGYLDAYHGPYTHTQSLKVLDWQGIRTIPTGRHSYYYTNYTDKPLEGVLVFPWEPLGMSYQVYIFPNTIINTAKDHVQFWQVRPLNPERTTIEIFIYQTPAQTQEFPLDLANYRADFDQFMEEDLVILRSLQEGINSRAYKVTQLAKEHELGIAHFRKIVADAIINNVGE
ncbi:MAG: aromatic ring-hydroxylating dioxygenase subunit alpha [Iphinoe sp. HA4291-MV1]|jgi:phenylpropionate dioxygenase-like ring-hydroxylating dioxygenase large terminal subunit|nr:aromatic ring-hydroxylating dioxygenase subunit alpha [Iphinoe sp. HA4291-MV1]